MRKFVILILMLSLSTCAMAPAFGRTWAQGAMRYIHRTGKCFGGQEVVASYYWSGRRTATGARFHPDGISVAHKKLPFGTRLHITNPHNGRTVDVDVNDRGPFVKGVTLDFSRGAARALGMTQSQYVCMN